MSPASTTLTVWQLACDPIVGCDFAPDELDALAREVDRRPTCTTSATVREGQSLDLMAEYSDSGCEAFDPTDPEAG